MPGMTPSTVAQALWPLAEVSTAHSPEMPFPTQHRDTRRQSRIPSLAWSYLWAGWQPGSARSRIPAACGRSRGGAEDPVGRSALRNVAVLYHYDFFIPWKKKRQKPHQLGLGLRQLVCFDLTAP